ncbi:MAG: response regulator, partial [Methylotetracoccus sp.]|nr:response regulator [Methylotetracoccus sp.]
MSHPVVLVIDDEPDIRELLAITLRRMGIHVLAAENLVQARSLLLETTIHLVLTDMRLPDGDGLDLV